MKTLTLSRSRFFATALLGCLGALSFSAAPAHAGLFSLSEQDEIKAGQEAAAQAQKEYGRALPANDARVRRVRAIGAKLAALSERKNIPYTYTVLQNDKVLNAFAAPGGPVFVTTKLISTTSNDAELAYVLGHETGHIDRRHIAKSVEKQQTVGLAAGILGAILGKGKNGNVIGTVINGTYTVWQRGYSRNDESEADAVGVRFMSRLGYDPRAALTMLKKLGAEGGQSGFLDKYLSTHPEPEARVKAVSAQIQKENLVDIARRSGGPRLNDNGRYSNASYTDDSGYNVPKTGGYTASNNGDQYPDYNAPTTNTSNNNGTYADAGYGSEVYLGAPLRIVDRDNGSVIMAPVAGLTRWAGAQSNTQGNVTTLTRGNQRLELRINSTVAWDNGQRRDLNVPPQLFNKQLYAPLGDVVEGLGGKARFDTNSNAVRISIDNRPEDSVPLR